MTIAKMTIWSLFDGSGLMIERAAEMGHKCYCFNYSEADLLMDRQRLPYAREETCFR